MLYEVTSSNTQGVDGKVYLSNGKIVETNHPLNHLPGFNPEELIALAWSTCLNATIKAILEQKGFKDLKSSVDVNCQLMKEKQVGKGFYFQVNAVASIEKLSLSDSKLIVNKAHSRCPISKLISNAKTINLDTVKWSV